MNACMNCQSHQSIAYSGHEGVHPSCRPLSIKSADNIFLPSASVKTMRTNPALLCHVFWCLISCHAVSKRSTYPMSTSHMFPNKAKSPKMRPMTRNLDPSSLSSPELKLSWSVYRGNRIPERTGPSTPTIDMSRGMVLPE